MQTLPNAVRSVRAAPLEPIAAAGGQAAEVEAARLEPVLRYDILNTPPDGAFDRITELGLAPSVVTDVQLAHATIACRHTPKLMPEEPAAWIPNANRHTAAWRRFPRRL